MTDKKNINKTIALLKKLVSFQTTADNIGEKRRIIDFAANEFKGSGVYIKKASSNNIPSLIVTLKKEKNPRLFLVGHLDVVPAERVEDFKAVVKGGRIYGRGTGDMKAACAVMIETMKYFAESGRRPSLGLILSTDEEIGGEDGVNFLLKKNRFKPELALVPDGGESLSTIVLKEKGVIDLRVKSFGRSAHGARPFLGVNAIDGLIRQYAEIRKIIPELRRGQWKNSLNLGKISGGQAINKVPDYAEMFLDIRIVDEHYRRLVLDKIRKAAPDTEIINEGSTFIQKKNRRILEYKNIFEKLLGKKIIFTASEGASDARFFCENKVPALITKIKCGNIHSRDEWVDIAEIDLFYRGLIEFAGKFNS